MFESISEVNWRIFASYYIRNAWLLALFAFLIVSLVPYMTESGRNDSIELIKDHLAPSSFNLLGVWVILFISAYALLFGPINRPSKFLALFGLQPANVVFVYGAIASGAALGSGISAYLFGQPKNDALWLFSGGIFLLILLAMFTLAIKILCFNAKFSATKYKLLAGLVVLLDVVAIFYYYGYLFIEYMPKPSHFL